MPGERIQHNSAQTTAKTKDTWRLYSEQSVRELELLADFYHKHGYANEAAEIRQAIANLRKHSDRAKSTKLEEKKS